MAKTIVTESYNMDLLSFLNVMTSDSFYLKFYQKEYDYFYPLISNGVKEGINALTASTGRSNIAPFFTTIISSLDYNNERDIKEMILEYDAIASKMKNFTYYSLYSDYIKLLPQLSGLIIQLISELEDNGYREYWEKERLPLIRKRCKEISEIVDRSNIPQHINRYKYLAGHIVVYICSFSHPHATRLCGNVLLVDYIVSDKTIINNVIHELFHPPYKMEDVKDIVTELGELDFVKKAYKEQDPQFAYEPMELFIEEHIVEALGIHVASSLGYEDNPYEYFIKHDKGSHVISPHLFRFLNQKDIEGKQMFTDYLRDFVDYLKAI